MKILIVSDIHANRQALEAINEPHDACFFLGDLVDYGCEPLPCIDWVRKHANYAVRGNHDHGAAQLVPIQGTSGFRYLTAATRVWTVRMLVNEHRRFLADLPLSQSLTLGGKKFLLVHGSPRDPLDEYAPPEVEFWQKRLEGMNYDYVLVGHTHRQYALQVGSTWIINPGSVGLPRDGDPRAAYAVLDGEKIRLERISYPWEATIAAVRSALIPDHAKEMLAEVYRTGKLTPRL
jgi:putative phosphoesterase